MKLVLPKDKFVKWGKNAVMFTAPALAVLFGLLAQEIPFKKAWPVALLALYGLMADYFKKLREKK